MKLYSVCAMIGMQGVSSAPADLPRLGQDATRYTDLAAIVKNFIPDFDERKYWAYGCHCLILGDRPMSLVGSGKPVDALDSSCRKYKQCQKCVKMNYGKECIALSTIYDYKIKKSGEVVPKNEPDTCERSLFECDIQFARDLKESVDDFSTDYHVMWTTNGFHPTNNPSSCPKKGTGPYEAECCGGSTSAYLLYNLHGRMQCCDDGSVKYDCTIPEVENVDPELPGDLEEIQWETN